MIAASTSSSPAAARPIRLAAAVGLSLFGLAAVAGCDAAGPTAAPAATSDVAETPAARGAPARSASATVSAEPRPTATPTATVPAFAFATGEAPIAPDAPPLATARVLEATDRRVEAEATLAALAAAGGPDAAKAAVALAGLLLDDGRAGAALEGLASGPGGLSALPPEGRYRLGEVLEALGWPAAAAEAYASFGESQPVMADVAAMAEGNAWFAAGEYARAGRAFETARAATDDGTTAFLAALRRANAGLRLDSGQAAAAAYEEAYDLATSDEHRAQALDGVIAAYAAADMPAARDDTRLRLVRDLPATDLARAALDRLEAAGVAVSPTLRAAVLGAAGEHAAAIDALGGFAGAEAAGPEALFQLARAQEGLDDGEAALASYALVAETAPDATLAPEAAWRAAVLLWDLGRGAEAVAAFRELAERWPGSARAGEALARWARAVEARQGPVAGAEALDAVVAERPGAPSALDDAFRAAYLTWRSGDVAAAERRLAELTDRGSGAQRARARYWLGRLAWDRGDRAAAEAEWSAAVGVDPFGYYGVRAAERVGAERSRPSGNSDEAMAGWLASWSRAAAPEDWAAIRASVAADRGVGRARAWLALGERKAAATALGFERRRYADDPWRLAALAAETEALGITEASAAAAERALALAPGEAQERAPLRLWALAYPPGLAEELRAAAGVEGLDPALLWGVIRQESRFEPTARSHVGATGLTQVMPATGEHIASMLGVDGFETSDLFDPAVGLRFGAWYLARQLERYDGRAWAALAAYNAGPGNADRWTAAAGPDQDVFVESVDFAETRSYLRRTVPAASIYRWLYGAGG